MSQPHPEPGTPADQQVVGQVHRRLVERAQLVKEIMAVMVPAPRAVVVVVHLRQVEMQPTQHRVATAVQVQPQALQEVRSPAQAAALALLAQRAALAGAETVQRQVKQTQVAVAAGHPVELPALAVPVL
jgi:hypothetical protein